MEQLRNMVSDIESEPSSDEHTEKLVSAVLGYISRHTKPKPVDTALKWIQIIIGVLAVTAIPFGAYVYKKVDGNTIAVSTLAEIPALVKAQEGRLNQQASLIARYEEVPKLLVEHAQIIAQHTAQFAAIDANRYTDEDAIGHMDLHRALAEQRSKEVLAIWQKIAELQQDVKENAAEIRSIHREIQGDKAKQ